MGDRSSVVVCRVSVVGEVATSPGEESRKEFYNLAFRMADVSHMVVRKEASSEAPAPFPFYDE